MCARCLEEQAGAAKINTVDGQRQRLDVLVESSSSDGGQSLGSSVGLVPASGSSSSGMTTASGASTPRSFWKLANPVEIV